jgi:uncharacterized protein (DUF983 family)
MKRASHNVFLQSVLRGFKGRCPQCGEGRLFWRYLKVEPRCQACGHDLARYPADDGPAYFTILIAGHLIVAPILFFPVVWEAPAVIMVPGILIPLAAVTLALLHVVKGAFIGALHAIANGESEETLRVAPPAE